MGAVSASWSNPPHLSHLRQDENFLAFHCSQPCPGFCPGAADPGGNIHRPGVCTTSHPVCSGVRAAGNSGMAAVRKSTSRSNFFCSAERPVHTTGDPVLASDCSDCRQLWVDSKNICLRSKDQERFV